MRVTFHHRNRCWAAGFWLFMVWMGAIGAGCCDRHEAPDGATVGADGRTLSGRVVSQPPGAGQVGIERWRFVPEGEGNTYLRLTRARMQEAISPEAKEIRLDEWAGKKIRVGYQGRDESWVWGAEVLK